MDVATHTNPELPVLQVAIVIVGTPVAPPDGLCLSSAYRDVPVLSLPMGGRTTARAEGTRGYARPIRARELIYFIAFILGAP